MTIRTKLPIMYFLWIVPYETLTFSRKGKADEVVFINTSYRGMWKLYKALKKGDTK